MTRPLRIVYLCNEFGLQAHGGLASAIQDLARWMSKKGHQVTIAGAYHQKPQYPEARTSADECEFLFRPQVFPSFIRRIPSRIGYICQRIWFAKRVDKLAAEFGADLVEVPDYNGWGAFLKVHRMPMVSRLHGTHLLYDEILRRTSNSEILYAERRALRRSNAWIGVSRYAMECTKKIVPGRRLEKVIFNAVDTQFFKPDPTITPVPGRIVFVNSLGPRKGIAELAAAFDSILTKHPHITLVAAGEGRDRFLQGIKARISPQARDRIEFIGFQPRDKLPLLYQSAQICCFPSKAETFGLGPAEAMACGRPVIFMSNGPGPELIQNGVNGLLVNGCVIHEIASALEKLLEDDDFCQNAGRFARESAVKNFGLNACGEESESFYYSMLGHSPRTTLK